MTHANAPLTPTDRLRMVLRHLDDSVPQAHVAAEFRVSRPTVATRVTRYRAEGEACLRKRTSRPLYQPNQIPDEVVEHIESHAETGSGQVAGSTITCWDWGTSCICAPWSAG